MKKILLLLCFAGLWANAEYAKACVKGNASACSNLGKTYENAPVGLRDNAAVQDAYKMACELKDANSCYKVGHMYHEYLYYEGVKADRAAAAKFYKKACDLGDGNGCSGLGMMYIEGIYVEQNYSKAVELYEKACDLGVAASCVKTAKLYTDGEIVEQNYSKVV
ncbi:MAG: sel1 repeat family protein, partial [Helicobacteraceae bacterium]|nr:sel1 repeat family protein [Helicobacteraceae bacterium]